jgi:hypothetical protein
MVKPMTTPPRDNREAIRAAVALLPDFERHIRYKTNYTLFPDQLENFVAALEALSGDRVVVPVVSVLEMKTSAGPDYFVSIKCGDRELTPYSFKIKGRAEFSAAEFQWLLNGGEKPDLSDWLDRTAITAITGVK